jgi:arylsulfatase
VEYRHALVSLCCGLTKAKELRSGKGLNRAAKEDSMLKSTKVQAMALVAVGALLGYAAASGNLHLNWPATAAPAATEPAAQPAKSEKPATCCGANLSKGELVALATHYEKVAAEAQDSGKKPSICIIWGDDIGQTNLSCYTHGLMGYQTPNIDRIAKEGMMFTDYYGEQSCTAGANAAPGRFPFICVEPGERIACPTPLR